MKTKTKTKNDDELLERLEDEWKTVKVSIINFYFRSVWVVTRFDGYGNSVVRFEIENADTGVTVGYEKYDVVLDIMDRYVTKCRTTGDWT